MKLLPSRKQLLNKEKCCHHGCLNCPWKPWRRQMFDESDIPDYAFFNDKKVCGFFGTFRFLSNFWPAKVHYEGLDYPSVENAYQAAKYPLNQRAEFTSISAGQAKKLGKRAPIDQKEWDKKKLEIMAILVLQKFLNNDTLKDMLLATEDAYLEETNAWGDLWWGCDEDGIGENHLGEILMEVRKALRKK